MELASIIISMITMILAFYMFQVNDTGIIIGVVVGIIGHEIGHKIVAQSMGFESRYKLWSIGLILVIAFAIITRGRFIFAAPGFVHTEGHASFRDEGIISLSAPATNILLAVFFFAIGGAWALSAAYVNLLLAGFNLLPLGPLDGVKVAEWSPTAWTSSMATVVLLGIVFLL
jgi:Zn-dependent protease